MAHNRTAAVLLVLGAILPAGVVAAQAPPPGQAVTIPADAEIEGIPEVRIDTRHGEVTRRVLDRLEADTARLTVSAQDGRLRWTSRDNQALRVETSEASTYLSAGPGRYIRLTRLHDRIVYTEHVELEDGSMTWWGELRIRLPR